MEVKSNIIENKYNYSDSARSVSARSVSARSIRNEWTSGKVRRCTSSMPSISKFGNDSFVNKSVSAKNSSTQTDVEKKTGVIARLLIMTCEYTPALLTKAWDGLISVFDMLPNPCSAISFTFDCINIGTPMSCLFSAGSLIKNRILVSKINKCAVELSDRESKDVSDSAKTVLETEIKKLFGVESNSETVDLETVSSYIQSLSESELPVAQRKFLIDFLKKITTESKDVNLGKIPYRDFYLAYRQDFCHQSSEARAALREQIEFKLTSESLLNNKKGKLSSTKFGISLSAAAVWLTLHSLVWSAIAIPAGAIYGVGIITSVVCLGLTAIGLAILARKKPESAKEFMKGTFFGEQIAGTLKKIMLYGLFYQYRIRHLENKIISLENEINLLEMNKTNSLKTSEEKTSENLDEKKRSVLVKKITDCNEELIKLKKNIYVVEKFQKKCTEKIQKAGLSDHLNVFKKYLTKTERMPISEDNFRFKNLNLNNYMGDISTVLAKDLMMQDREVDKQEAIKMLRAVGINYETLLMKDVESTKQSIQDGIAFFMSRNASGLAELHKAMRNQLDDLIQKSVLDILKDNKTDQFEFVLPSAKTGGDTATETIIVKRGKRDNKYFSKKIARQIRKNTPLTNDMAQIYATINNLAKINATTKDEFRDESSIRTETSGVLYENFKRSRN